MGESKHVDATGNAKQRASRAACAHADVPRIRPSLELHCTVLLLQHLTPLKYPYFPLGMSCLETNGGNQQHTQSTVSTGFETMPLAVARRLVCCSSSRFMCSASFKQPALARLTTLSITSSGSLRMSSAWIHQHVHSTVWAHVGGYNVKCLGAGSQAGQAYLLSICTRFNWSRLVCSAMDRSGPPPESSM